jgi:hypothetical protein
MPPPVAGGLAAPPRRPYLSPGESDQSGVAAMHCAVRVTIVLAGLASGAPALAEDGGAAAAEPPAAATGAAGAPAAGAKAAQGDARKTICGLIEAAAAANQLPVDLFTRLIWKESTFHPGAVSPKGAEGIAQFIPGTASLRGLADPFDPVEAIPAAATYIHDLIGRFGNIGLAAAAYNAGEQRVSDWLAGSGGLPYETEDYVLTITGRAAAEWAKPEAAPPAAIAPAPAAAPPAAAKPAATCLTVAAALARHGGAGAAVVESIAKAPFAPWGVQVAGNFSLDRAMASFTALTRRFPAIVTGPPMVMRAVDRSRGPAPLYQIRLPATDRKQATDLCHRLEAAGGACVVFRN